MEEVKVYWLLWRRDDNVGRLEARTREIEAGTPEEKVTRTVHALLEGPDEEERHLGFNSEIPDGTRLLDAWLEGSVVHLDLSGEIESGGGSVSMLGRVSQIVYTATQFEGVEAVRVLIDGQFRASLGGEGVMIDGPLSRSSVPSEF